MPANSYYFSFRSYEKERVYLPSLRNSSGQPIILYMCKRVLIVQDSCIVGSRGRRNVKECLSGEKAVSCSVFGV